MLSLGIGLQKLATRQLGRSGLFDTVVVTSRQDSREPRGTDVKLTPDQANQLLGKYIVLRYHKREAGESAPLAGKTTKKGEADPDDVDSADDIKAEDAQSFNLVPKTLKLKIVGIVSSEPNRGLRQGRTPVFLPLALAESLDMVQAGELWRTVRPSESKTYIA